MADCGPDVVGAARAECADRATVGGELEEQLADVAARSRPARRADLEESRVADVLENVVEASLGGGGVTRRVLAIRRVEQVDVELRRAVTLVDDLADLRQRRRHERATRAGDLEELVLGEFPGLGRMRDEHDLELPVLTSQTLHGPEEKCLRELATVLAHARGHVEHQEYDGLCRRLLATRQLAETQVLVGKRRRIGLHRLALHRLAHRAPAIQPGAGAAPVPAFAHEFVVARAAGASLEVGELHLLPEPVDDVVDLELEHVLDAAVFVAAATASGGAFALSGRADAVPGLSGSLTDAGHLVR